MIKQENGVFKLIPFTAKISDKEYLVDDKAQFEEMILQELKMEAELEGGSGEVKLPSIQYKQNTLDEWQKERLKTANSFHSLSLDEARDFVMENYEPKNIEYQMLKKDSEIAALKEQNITAMSALAEVYELLLGE